jgi:epoxyqueuosine reductase
VGAWTFGCDECQTVCPWNGRAPVSGEPAFRPRRHPSATELLALDEAEYREVFRGSPLKRARRDGLARNAAIALGNDGTAAGVSALTRALGHVEPAVRGHAAWALGRIGGEEARAALLAARSREGDPGTLEEMTRALTQLSMMETTEGRIHS